MNEQVARIAAQFCPDQTVSSITPLGKGLINSTFLIDASGFRFVLQRINDHVFPRPKHIIENLLCINRHLQGNSAARLTLPTLLQTTNGCYFFVDQQGHYWRALQLIENAESRENITRITEAEQTGFALAHFHRLLSELPPHVLHDTLPSFHITPHYLHLYHQSLATTEIRSTDRAFADCRRYIERFQHKADILEQAKLQGLLTERIIHGDPKLNNFLFAENTDTIVSLIDLDTVKPGLIHYDIGDCLRSCCHINDGNRFDLDLCEAILRQYLKEAGQFMTEADYDYLYAAIELIPFELGLRFFTDYLNGNRYFKVDFHEQNLQRAIAQFALTQDIGIQRGRIQTLIDRLRLDA